MPNTFLLSFERTEPDFSEFQELSDFFNEAAFVEAFFSPIYGTVLVQCTEDTTAHDVLHEVTPYTRTNVFVSQLNNDDMAYRVEEDAYHEFQSWLNATGNAPS